MLLRLTTIALCAAGVILLATLEPIRLEIVRPAPRDLATAGSSSRNSSLSVVDVAEGMAPADLASLVTLKPGERVTAINDRPLGSDLSAGSLIASQGLRAGEYLDLTVSGTTAERRVLVLLH
jgi:hypothetical protein